MLLCLEGAILWQPPLQPGPANSACMFNSTPNTTGRVNSLGGLKPLEKQGEKFAGRIAEEVAEKIAGCLPKIRQTQIKNSP